MKKHLLKINVIILLFSVLLGCRKEEHPLVQDENILLKAFYTSQKPDAGSPFKNTNPNWNKIVKLKHDDFTIYEIPMQNPDKVGITSKPITDYDISNYEKNHALKLLLFIDKNNKVVKGCYMAIEASSFAELERVHYKAADGLNGYVMYYNLDGTISNGVTYTSGKPIYKMKSVTAEELMLLNSQNKVTLVSDGSRVVQGCSTYFVETGYYYCVVTPYSENCGWQSTGFSSFTSCESGPQDTSLEDYSGGSSGGGGGGGDTSSGSVNAEDPGEAYELTVIADSIKLTNRFNCFSGVATNANTIYSIKICADIPDNSNPKALLVSGSPGHTFIELTKTNGANSVTQTFGFYPKSATKAAFQLDVKSMIVDNKFHPYDASFFITINASQFEDALETAIIKSANDYNMTGYNCTTFALDVFNSARGSSNQLIVPSTVPQNTMFSTYGKTPNGLYQTINGMKANGVSGAAVGSDTGKQSTNCN